MSVSRECAYIEVTDRGGWYLFLAREEYGELTPWSADCIGPFSTGEEAYQHCRDNYSNPGGSWSRKGQTYAALDRDLRKMMDQAENPRKRMAHLVGWW